MSKSIGAQLRKKIEEDDAYSFYKYFEPWDVEDRPAYIYQLAEKDGVNLFHEDYIRTGNVGAHPFQSGFLLSTANRRGTIAATQCGKTLPTIIEIGCMCSGEFPISLQYDKGVDTGIERQINSLNIRRFGRFDKETGTLLDYDEDAVEDGSWNCGTIIGAGKYPKEKVIPKDMRNEKAERVIWVGTTQKAAAESWWPRLTEEGRRMLPEKFIDKTRGNNGTNQANGYVVHLVNNIRLSLISYESGYRKFEAVTVWSCIFDEESPDSMCLTAALTHCKFFSMQMTPYNGMTYTKDFFFKNVGKNKDVFHATAYDCPYITEDDIQQIREEAPEHQVGARVWGEHTAESKLPYYNSVKLRSWLRGLSETAPGIHATFAPSEEYINVKKQRGSSLPCLMDIEAKLMPADGDEKDEAGHNMAWTIFEERIEGAAYFLVSDAANGADLPQDAGDFQAAVVFRKPMFDKESDPVIVAEIETTVTPDRFALLIGLALRYYGNALLCAESPRAGSANGMFFAEMREYPYWFKRSIQRQNTTRYIEQQGVDTNVATRKCFFDKIEKVFGRYTKDEMPPIPSRRILTMASECGKVIKNGNIKADHPRNKPNDLLICYGIGLWVYETFPEQIRCRIKSDEKVAKHPKDCVISLLTAKRAKENTYDPHFPQNAGSRR